MLPVRTIALIVSPQMLTPANDEFDSSSWPFVPLEDGTIRLKVSVPVDGDASTILRLPVPSLLTLYAPSAPESWELHAACRRRYRRW